MEDKTIHPVSVQILGKPYTVACPADEVALLMQSADRVDQDMRDIRDAGKIFGSERIAIMVALNLAHELLSQQKNTRLSEGGIALQVQLEQLQEKVDSVLQRYQNHTSSKNPLTDKD